MKEDTQTGSGQESRDKGGEGGKLQGQADLLDWSVLSTLAGGWGRS